MKIPPEWNILPLPPNEKFPPPDDFQNTPYSREKLKDHKGNYGIATGMISGGLWVVDWDFREGRKEEGIKYIFSLYKEILPHLAKTLVVNTPNGFHFYYLCKDDTLANTHQTNIGYSKTLKKFTSQNSTRFANFLSGVDTRGNGGYVVCPPSKVKDGKYEWATNERLPLEITKEQTEEILKFFEIPKKEIAENTIRQGFVDILEGKIDPNKIASKDCSEQVYWGEMFHECVSLGLLPEDLYEGLQKYQKGFSLEKTLKQLKNKKKHDYIFNGKRLSNEKYEKYFHIKKRKVQAKKKKTMFDEDEEEDDPIDADIIVYDHNELHIYDDHINYSYASGKSVKVEKMLDCSFKIFRKCYYKKEELFSYILNGKTFYTDSILDILHKAEPYLRKGLRGRDCLKEAISYYSNKIKNTQPKEFLGFDNGWVLPQTEQAKDISIVVITDYQQEAYIRAKNMIKEYKAEEKIHIQEDVRTFIDISQAEKINLAALIGWSIAAPFRLFFIREYDLFPILYNYGNPNTGRSTLEDFWVRDFYRIYKAHLPPNTSIPRLEDHLSQSTFPQSLQDLKESNVHNNRDLISMLQDYSTSIGLFERKKGAKEIEFIKYKIAGLNLDSNDILEMFSAPAINERQVFFQYNQKVQLDIEWINMRKKMKKYKLFSLIYDHTKDWTDQDVEALYQPILEDYNETFKTNSSRLIKSAAIIRFGLKLFDEVFDYNFNISDDELLETIVSGSTKMTEYVVDQFREYCILAINYDEATQTIKDTGQLQYVQTYKGDNPHYLNHKLRLSHNKKYYAYTSSNHEDYKKRFNDRAGMKTLVEKLHKGMDINEMKFIKYAPARPFKENGVLCKPMGIIKIYPRFINDSQLDGKDLIEYDKIKRDD
ncbi:MAG: bifunctional DNA primase/polymerase [Candidatus Thorarchaeota archaeon]